MSRLLASLTRRISLRSRISGVWHFQRFQRFCWIKVERAAQRSYAADINWNIVDLGRGNLNFSQNVPTSEIKKFNKFVVFIAQLNTSRVTLIVNKHIRFSKITYKLPLYVASTLSLSVDFRRTTGALPADKAQRADLLQAASIRVAVAGGRPRGVAEEIRHDGRRLELRLLNCVFSTFILNIKIFSLTKFNKFVFA